ncbi:MAG: radical SAM protein, partial [Desulfocapsaceae bacterium]|nr:radical SAM protein [Desulfocapsaceae bacterium]
MYTYLFGPVPSRRLGISLGVDLVVHKTCSFDCIYCECGATTNLTVDRREYVPFADVVKELDDYFSNHPDPDYITFSGSGEPCLNSRIGDVINYIRSQKPDIAIAVLTNGTLLHRADVRQELLGADLVMPSLDAASLSALQTVNRPHTSINLETYIGG